jgi:hypothetical protein
VNITNVEHIVKNAKVHKCVLTEYENNVARSVMDVIYALTVLIRPHVKYVVMHIVNIKNKGVAARLVKEDPFVFITKTEHFAKHVVGHDYARHLGVKHSNQNNQNTKAIVLGVSFICFPTHLSFVTTKQKSRE